MHEYSIVASLLDVCEKQAHSAGADKVKCVKLKIGRLSGIEPHFMESCFEVFKEDTLCHDAELMMDIVDTKIYCKECDKEYVVLKNNFYCPACKSPETEVIEGQEMIVESIEVVGKDI